MKKNASASSTILVIVVGFLVLSYIFEAKSLVLIATVIGVVALVFPVTGRWIEFVWFKFAEVLGWINARLILGIVFFVILFPIALLYRLSAKNPLNIRKVQGSLFVTRDHNYSKKDFENMW